MSDLETYRWLKAEDEMQRWTSWRVVHRSVVWRSSEQMPWQSHWASARRHEPVAVWKDIERREYLHLIHRRQVFHQRVEKLSLSLTFLLFIIMYLRQVLFHTGFVRRGVLTVLQHTDIDGRRWLFLVSMSFDMCMIGGANPEFLFAIFVEETLVSSDWSHASVAALTDIRTLHDHVREVLRTMSFQRIISSERLSTVGKCTREQMTATQVNGSNMTIEIRLGVKCIFTCLEKEETSFSPSSEQTRMSLTG